MNSDNVSIINLTICKAYNSWAERYGSVIHVYCLMDNHYHLLMEKPSGNLSQILYHINGAYTAYFNTKRKRFGHLFQGWWVSSQRNRGILRHAGVGCQSGQPKIQAACCWG
jgi:REP element-mobilizing transposase RayT